MLLHSFGTAIGSFISFVIIIIIIIIIKGICAITNLDLSDLQRLQASLRLPVKEGGLGCASRYFAGTICFFSIRRKYRRSPAAAVTSQSDVATTDTAVSLAKNIWSSAVHSSLPPTGLSAHKQSAWDKPVMASERLELNNSLSNPADQARLLATTSPHSAW